MLKLDKVSAKAGSFRLEPLDLEITPGECHALLGPSGAGKSTVLELIVGFRELQSGSIILNGRNLEHVPVEQRNIGYLPQNLALFPHLTVRENILYGIRSRRKPDKHDVERIDSITKAMGVKQLENRKTIHLSGGERQRVALARALAPAPELLILDEPFSALNEALRRELSILLKELQQTYNLTTIIVTHDLEEAFYFGEKIHILINGRLHQSGPRRQVFDQPATLDVARFLDIKNIFTTKVVHADSFITTLECEKLGIRFTVEKSSHNGLRLNNGDMISIGIRPEFLSVNHNSSANSEDNVFLKGAVVDKIETIGGLMLSIRPKDCDGLIKVAIGFRAAPCINLDDEVVVQMPYKHIFYINS